MRAASVLIAFASLAAAPAAARTLSSADVKPGAAIAPAQIYPRCGGANRSPALSWSGVPKAAKSLAVTMIDHDVNPNEWSHWILVDLPPTATGLPADLKAPPKGARGVKSNFGSDAYAGPCPPKGTGVHHYEITVWAFSQPHVELAPNAKAKDLEAQLQRQSIAHASITGTVQR